MKTSVTMGTLTLTLLFNVFIHTVYLTFSSIKKKSKKPKTASLICSKPSHSSLLAQRKGRRPRCGQRGRSVYPPGPSASPVSPAHYAPAPPASVCSLNTPQGLCIGCRLCLDRFSPQHLLTHFLTSFKSFIKGPQVIRGVSWPPCLKVPPEALPTSLLAEYLGHLSP